MTERERKVVYLAAVILFVLFMAAVTYYIGIPMVRFAEEPVQFRQWKDSAAATGKSNIPSW